MGGERGDYSMKSKRRWTAPNSYISSFLHLVLLSFYSCFRSTRYYCYIKNVLLQWAELKHMVKYWTVRRRYEFGVRQWRVDLASERYFGTEWSKLSKWSLISLGSIFSKRFWDTCRHTISFSIDCAYSDGYTNSYKHWNTDRSWYPDRYLYSGRLFHTNRCINSNGCLVSAIGYLFRYRLDIRARRYCCQWRHYLYPRIWGNNLHSSCTGCHLYYFAAGHSHFHSQELWSGRQPNTDSSGMHIQFISTCLSEVVSSISLLDSSYPQLRQPVSQDGTLAIFGTCAFSQSPTRYRIISVSIYQISRD